ncbi:MAG: hypothetical protein A2746_00060 [Candidatus Yanofskybacteria bacterium RIFCSPHIGHO2_01_FULL_44_22]|uniref:Uncharacterized protein n=1 Tax=Candidatus Yanofskybacteria bacterium RIFCSPHIGHO2_01_FULL_44_22 TaxID=1802669 RepID=A0A1F8EXK0_9BACT|nr:MAG: hypothetical protein A2746_00060 [Candidatus Yanofskybacteria bacterium RIFCSPHIGHO2_01_FULL_44_22]
MFIIDIFSRMRRTIHQKVLDKEPGLYVSLIFPISVAFLLTFVGARIFSHLYPDFYIPWSKTIRIHHYAYGFFVLAASGYLALIFSGPRAKFLISLLHGFGLGLAFDEFGIWLKLSDSNPARWSYDGFLVMSGLFLFVISAGPGLKMLKILWPFGPRLRT